MLHGEHRGVSNLVNTYATVKTNLIFNTQKKSGIIGSVGIALLHNYFAKKISMRLVTCFLVYAIVFTVTSFHSGQPYAAVCKPDMKRCSHCPAKNCPAAQKTKAKESRDQHLVLSDMHASKPTVQTDYVLFPWNNKIRMLLN